MLSFYELDEYFTGCDFSEVKVFILIFLLPLLYTTFEIQQM